ncbi:membrane dipeptidase [Sphingomonas parva]|uniref:Membrane dipeptidase n=1 Tax=Sphingomonas parva TaxID=2555898 RepID=A0A4Y8ZQJ2_9SPHN|nr:dipeptidase [Sphingomonas parva]TFI58234.1 membrane dipeptidase [Sphingomonas parva]
MRIAPFVTFGLALAAPAPAHPQVSPADRLAHEEMLVLDTHLDTPVLFERQGWDFSRWHEYAWDNSQVDIPRMEAGGLDGGFFVIYTSQGSLDPAAMAKAKADALMRATAIQRVVASHPDKLAFATTADDAERLHKEGKHIVFQSIENSYPLGDDLSLLGTYYRLGVRMAGPVHSKNNQFGDSATDTPRWNGLSPLGRQWVAEMNRLGMIIDGSHSSDAVFDQMLALSKAPIILSHSGPKAMFDHKRNIDDERMRKLAKAGGVMFVNSVFLVPFDNSEERGAITDRQESWETLSPADRRRLVAEKTALDATHPYTTANFELYMKSLLHTIAVMGVDHVGLGADWDGGGGVLGMEDVSALPLITARLRKEGFKDADIAKIMGGNLLRVMRAVQAQAEKAPARR